MAIFLLCEANSSIWGSRVYYYAAGSRGAGDPIVLVHGFPTSGHLWLDVVAKLPAGHRVIVLDLLGFGRSDAPGNADYGVAGHGKRLIQLLDALKIERAMLVGHGTGCAIVSWTALEAPDRASGIVLVGGATSEGWMATSGTAERALYRIGVGLPRPMRQSILRTALARDYSDPERGRRSADIYLTPFARPEGGGVLRRHLSDLSDGDIESLGTRLVELSVPVYTTSRTSWRFVPEESPSEVAASIARALTV